MSFIYADDVMPAAAAADYADADAALRDMPATIDDASAGALLPATLHADEEGACLHAVPPQEARCQRG